MYEIHCADSFELIQSKNFSWDHISLVIADPVYGNMVSDWIGIVPRGKPLIVFMSVDNLYEMAALGVPKPDQIAHWVKAVSTKANTKNYSKFIEVIAMWNVKFHKGLHWSMRTGIYTDQLIDNREHPWKKPKSLIEKLLFNHYFGNGYVLDPFAGSFVVHQVCRQYGIPSISVEIDVNLVSEFYKNNGIWRR